jgi:shikimate kinase
VAAPSLALGRALLPTGSAMTHIVLVGLMGSGKTTIGRRVAEQLGRQFIDSDDVVEERTGRTVRQIWLEDGEDAFRALERSALLDALAAAAPIVIAAAGGVVLADDNRKALLAADATVVWLGADADVLARRAARGAHRPLLDDDPHAALRHMASSREELYREVADFVVEVGERTVEEVAADVIAVARR